MSSELEDDFSDDEELDELDEPPDELVEPDSELFFRETCLLVELDLLETSPCVPIAGTASVAFLPIAEFWFVTAYC